MPVSSMWEGGYLFRSGRNAPEPDMIDIAENTRRLQADASGPWNSGMEPGRFLVARAGVLLARVTQNQVERGYVGIETGMNSLIRPTLYGAWHEIVNLSRLDEPLEITADVVGPICETGDVLGYGRRPAEHRGRRRNTDRYCRRLRARDEQRIQHACSGRGGGVEGEVRNNSPIRPSFHTGS